MSSFRFVFAAISTISMQELKLYLARHNSKLHKPKINPNINIVAEIAAIATFQETSQATNFGADFCAPESLKAASLPLQKKRVL